MNMVLSDPIQQCLHGDTVKHSAFGIGFREVDHVIAWAYRERRFANAL